VLTLDCFSAKPQPSHLDTCSRALRSMTAVTLCCDDCHQKDSNAMDSGGVGGLGLRNSQHGEL